MSLAALAGMTFTIASVSIWSWLSFTGVPRAPGEIHKEFTQRVALEEPWTPDPHVLERPGPEPGVDLEAEP